jgi:hypothetical protein
MCVCRLLSIARTFFGKKEEKKKFFFVLLIFFGRPASALHHFDVVLVSVAQSGGNKKKIRDELFLWRQKLHDRRAKALIKLVKRSLRGRRAHCLRRVDHVPVRGIEAKQI